jgi:dihydrodipicolinate synthase/N-acetylneuraminate lyase
MGTSKLTHETLKGVWAAVTLPWCEDLSLNEAAFRENLRRLIAARVHGIYTTGSTGEFYALDWDEFRHMVDIFTGAVSASGIPVQVGCAADDTREACRQVEYACRAGADGVQVALPYWMELTDREILQFFRDVAAASAGVPIIHYNITRAKNYLGADDYRRILEVAPNLIGVKFAFAGTHFGQLQNALQMCPQIAFFVAENLLVTGMQMGIRGSYSSVVCMNPQYMLRMFGLAEARKWDEALAMQMYLVRFFRELGGVLDEMGAGGIDPVCDKGMSVASGMFTGHQRTRPPYIGWSDEQVRRFRGWLEREHPGLLAPQSLIGG